MGRGNKSQAINTLPKQKFVGSTCDNLLGLKSKGMVKKVPGRRQSSVLSTTSFHKFKKQGKMMINQYKVIRQLGSGSFAKVKLVEDINTQTQFALKIMNKKELKSKVAGKGKTAYDCVLDELEVLKRIDHPNIILLTEIINDENRSEIYLVTEYHSLGSVGDKIRALNVKYEDYNKQCKKENKLENQKRVGIVAADCRIYFIDMIKALYYCHKVIKVIHRDIKPDNIMINHNNLAVLIDFGVSAIVENDDDT